MNVCKPGRYTEERLAEVSDGVGLARAVGQWVYRGVSHDFEDALCGCELCTEEGQRFHFRLENSLTQRRLWVGAGCMLRYAFPVVHEGVTLSRRDASAHIKNSIAEHERSAVISRLLKAAVRMYDNALADAIVHYHYTGHLTPRFAATIYLEMEREGISRNVRFPIYLRRDSDKAELQALNTLLVWRFWHAMTPAQRREATRLGHQPLPSNHPLITAANESACYL